MQRFNWDDLRFLLAVAREGGVSRAARAMGVDHATVIRRLEGLERALGARLFQRNARGYTLTGTGERLLLSAQVMEGEADRVALAFDSEPQSVTGALSISALEGIGNFFIAPRLGRFAAQNPELLLSFMTLQQLVALSRREADIAVTLHPPEQGRFQVTKLTDYRLHVYGSREYLDRAPPVADRGDLARHRFTGYIDDLIFVRELNYLDEIGVVTRPRLQTSSIHIQLELVRQGFGLCVLPRFIAATCPDLVAVCPDSIALTRSYWVVVHPDVAGTARGRRMVEFLMEEAREAQDAFLGAG